MRKHVSHRFIIEVDMKNWKIIIEMNGKPETVVITASSYADAYVKVGLLFPGSEIKSITEIRQNN